MYYSIIIRNNNIPIIIDDRVREELSNHPCNYRHNNSEVISFANNLFTNVTYKFYYEDNKIDPIIIRGTNLLKEILLTKNSNKNIVIFTHGRFMKYFLNSMLLKHLNTNNKCFGYPDNLQICKIKLLKI